MTQNKLDTVTTRDNDPTCVTYIINGEDDTLGNALRYVIATYPGEFLSLCSANKR